MTLRALVLCSALAPALLLACAGPVDNGNACFESSECRSASSCMQTAYGKFCMELCNPDVVVLCEDGQSCLKTSDATLGAGGTGGSGGEGGAGGVGAAGAGGTGGTLWVCLPGELQIPGFVPQDFGQPCDYSLDCVVGGVCVCTPGANCEPGSEDGPTCQRLCDPTTINQCPRINDLQPECTPLGDGRGFCDLSTLIP
jgi:hypothetical protein